MYLSTELLFLIFIKMSQDETDNILAKTDLQHMLEFETQIFLDIVHNDGLVIAAK